ncbi:Uncharacterised protein [Vibrio cholerae]|nr:Uncharacterised protein [Vibrio cholerae]CSI85325.1 Uncharacterised protein [Vibrio cholerae]
MALYVHLWCKFGWDAAEFLLRYRTYSTGYWGSVRIFRPTAARLTLL